MIQYNGTHYYMNKEAGKITNFFKNKSKLKTIGEGKGVPSVKPVVKHVVKPVVKPTAPAVTAPKKSIISLLFDKTDNLIRNNKFIRAGRKHDIRLEKFKDLGQMSKKDIKLLLDEDPNNIYDLIDFGGTGLVTPNDIKELKQVLNEGKPLTQRQQWKLALIAKDLKLSTNDVIKYTEKVPKIDPASIGAPAVDRVSLQAKLEKGAKNALKKKNIEKAKEIQSKTEQSKITKTYTGKGEQAKALDMVDETAKKAVKTGAPEDLKAAEDALNATGIAAQTGEALKTATKKAAKWTAIGSAIGIPPTAAVLIGHKEDSDLVKDIKEGKIDLNTEAGVKEFYERAKANGLYEFLFRSDEANDIIEPIRQRIQKENLEKLDNAKASSKKSDKTTSPTSNPSSMPMTVATANTEAVGDNSKPVGNGEPESQTLATSNKVEKSPAATSSNTSSNTTGSKKDLLNDLLWYGGGTGLGAIAGALISDKNRLRNSLIGGGTGLIASIAAKKMLSDDLA